MTLRPFARLTTAALVLIALLTCAAAAYAEPAETQAGQSDRRLTEAERQEIAALYQDIWSKKRTVINKYVEYGVLSEEKGKKIIEKMEKRFSMLEQNGYVPNWKKCHEKHMKEKQK